MYKCPVCNNSLHWQSDQDDGERCYGYYTCYPCDVDVFIGIGNEREIDEDE